MSYYLTSALGLQSLEIKKVNQTKKEIQVWVKQRRKTADCPICGKRTKKLHDYLPESKIRHLKIGQRVVYLLLKKRRFTCEKCDKTFTEKVPGLRKYSQTTNLGKLSTLLQLKDRSFSAAGKYSQVSYHTQARWLTSKLSKMLNSWKKEMEQKKNELAIGIDEISFSGHDMLLTLTNLTDHIVKGIFPDNTKRTLTKVLKQIPEVITQKIKWICIDMNYSYLKTIKEILPQVRVMIDHFHVIAYANDQIDEQRKILQDYHQKKIPRKIWLKNREDLNKKEREKINFLLNEFPEMRLYWLAKEKLRRVYVCSTREKGQIVLKAIIEKLASTDDPRLHKWARTLTRFEEQILNYFDSGGLTNAYTEGVNNKLKLIKRTSFGFRNKEVFIAKSLFSFLWAYLLPQFLT